MSREQNAAPAREAAAAEDTGRGPVKSAERTVAIMEVLAAAPGRLTLAQLQERTGYPRSSLYALLRTLAALRWVEVQEGEAAGFAIGPRALLCGTAYLDRDRALPSAVRAIEEVRADTGYTTHYARLDGSNVIYLATREATDSRRLTSRVGRQLPAHATALGTALLSELTADEVAVLLPPGPLEALTPRTVTSRAILAGELEQTRSRGWAVEHERNTLGLCCVAVAVPYRIPATDAISCSIPLGHASEQEIARVAEALMHHSAALAQTLRREGIR